MKEETAVKWLIEKLESHIMWTDKARAAFEQAKEMEKEQRKQEYLKGMKDANELRIEQEKQNL